MFTIDRGVVMGVRAVWDVVIGVRAVWGVATGR